MQLAVTNGETLHRATFRHDISVLPHEEHGKRYSNHRSPLNHSKTKLTSQSDVSNFVTPCQTMQCMGLKLHRPAMPTHSNVSSARTLHCRSIPDTFFAAVTSLRPLLLHHTHCVLRMLSGKYLMWRACSDMSDPMLAAEHASRGFFAGMLGNVVSVYDRLLRLTYACDTAWMWRTRERITFGHCRRQHVRIDARSTSCIFV